MKNILNRLLPIAVLALAFCATGHAEATTEPPPPIDTMTDSVHYPTAIVPYDGGVLIANTAAKNLPPAGNERTGYVIFNKGSKTVPWLNAEKRRLNFATGMAIGAGCLFVADRSCVTVFDLRKPAKPPQIIIFPAENHNIGDVAINDNTLYVSWLDTGRIYSLDITRPDRLENLEPQLFATMPGGAGSMVINDNAMYVASAPKDYDKKKVTAANVVYRIPALNDEPTAEIFMDKPGVYGDMAISADKRTLFISELTGGTVTAADTATGEAKVLYRKEGAWLMGLACADDTLYIGNLFDNSVTKIDLRRVNP